MENKKTTIVGTYVKTIRKNYETGYTVFTFSCKDFDEYKKRGKITCIGCVPVITRGIPLKLTGVFKETSDETYSFFVETLELYSDKREITIDYLKGDRFKGIGLKTAQKIIDITGNDIFSFIKSSNAKEKLISIPELNNEKVEMLLKTIKETFFEKDIYEYIKMYGGNYSDSQLLFSKYGVNAITKIKEHPYDVGIELKLPFAICDAIAKENNIFPLNETRVKSIIINAVFNISNNGNTLASLYDIYQAISYISKNSAFPDTLIPCVVIACYLEKLSFIIKDKDENGKKVYELKEFFDAEKTISKCINIINNSRQNFMFDLIDEIEKVENSLMIRYSEKQKDAFKFLLTSGIKILTGGPGTGKSTVINGLIKLFKKLHPNSTVSICAPTGRAAQKIKEITNHNATTIHKLLNIRPYTSDNKENFDVDKIDADLLVVDEFSMVDTKLFAYLINAVKPTSTIILCGDEFQLPSVLAGNVLHDLIETKLFETVRLDVIHRQKELSEIISFSNDIKSGNIKKWMNNAKKKEMKVEENKKPVKTTYMHSNKELQIIKTDSIFDIRDIIVHTLKKTFFNKKSKLYQDNILDLQILSSTKKDASGTLELNKIIHNAYQKESSSEGSYFSIGDKVMMTENNYDVGYFNGDMGFVKDFDIIKKCILIEVNGEIIEVPEINIKDISLAYASTIHKSQGSEYDYVIIALPKEPISILQRNLIYTAVTRARKYVAIIYEDDALLYAVKHNNKNLRKTNLTKKILNYEREML